ncbi:MULTISPECIES: hypothetical protein [unclassified Nocardiopsis]|nr:MULTISPECIES: hypothetical protein [unclassified Nocardiopsis]
MFITAVRGKHDDNPTSDGHKPPIPSLTPDDGGFGCGKHEGGDK